MQEIQAGRATIQISLKEQINKLKLTSQMQTEVISTLLTLRPRELEKIFPKMKMDPMAHSTTARDIQLETINELEGMLEHAIRIRKTLIRLGAYLEEEGKTSKEIRVGT